MGSNDRVEAKAGSSVLETTVSGGFWLARLNRPDKRNALSDELVDALTALFGRIGTDPDARALVLWGAGGHFCAGADFARFAALMDAPTAGDGPDPIAPYNRRFGTMLEALSIVPVPTIAVVKGSAMGGGFGLAATCDRVIAQEGAVFSMPEVRIGVAPAQIAPFVLRRLGPTRGRWLMLSGASLDAAAALESGLADVVTNAADLRATVAATLESLAGAEPGALRTTKRIVESAQQVPLHAALDGAAQEFAGLLRRGAAKEGMAASRARRPPAWKSTVPDLPAFD